MRACVTFAGRNLFPEVLRVIAASKAEIVMFIELNEEHEGTQWIKMKDLYGVMIQGKKSGVLLQDALALEWSDQGCIKWFKKRVSTVEINKISYVSVYQPLWKSDSAEFES